MFSPRLPHFYFRLAEKGVKREWNQQADHLRNMGFYLLNNQASSKQYMYFIDKGLGLRVKRSVASVFKFSFVFLHYPFLSHVTLPLGHVDPKETHKWRKKKKENLQYLKTF